MLESRRRRRCAYNSSLDTSREESEGREREREREILVPVESHWRHGALSHARAMRTGGVCVYITMIIIRSKSECTV